VSPPENSPRSVRRTVALSCLLMAPFAGCGRHGYATLDAPGMDAPVDSSSMDAPSPDVGRDAPTFDAPFLDGGADAPIPDAGTDAPLPDAGSEDVGPAPPGAGGPPERVGNGLRNQS